MLEFVFSEDRVRWVNGTVLRVDEAASSFDAVRLRACAIETITRARLRLLRRVLRVPVFFIDDECEVQTISIDSDEEFETQTITDTYRFNERGSVFRSAQKKAWCGIKPGCHRAGCACPVLMHDISSDPDER